MYCTRSSTRWLSRRRRWYASLSADDPASGVALTAHCRRPEIMTRVEDADSHPLVVTSEIAAAHEVILMDVLVSKVVMPV